MALEREGKMAAEKKRRKRERGWESMGGERQKWRGMREQRSNGFGMEKGGDGQRGEVLTG